MINGAHSIIYTTDPEGVRALFRDVLGLPSVDAGGGWLIFALPPAELGVHPVNEGEAPHHAIGLMCDDITATIAELRERGIAVRGEPEDMGFGIGVTVALPGVDVFLYEPRHPTAV